MLTVIAIIAVLAGLLLPALGNARERGRRIACVSNLRQIGIGILAFAGDNQNHLPSANQNTGTSAWSGGTTAWYTLLTNSYINSTKVFQCPDDRRTPSAGATPCSYAIVVGAGNTSPQNNLWIAGSRLTCPWLTNSQVAIVGEIYGSVPQTFEKGNGNNQIAFITSSSDASPSAPAYDPSSKHLPSNILAGNYLFLDGHVEWVEKLTGSSSDPLAAQMFPPPPNPNTISCP